MEFRGTDLRETISRAVKGASGSKNDRRNKCAQIWLKVGDLERELPRLNRGIEELEREMNSIQVQQLIAAADLTGKIVSAISPAFRGIRGMMRIAVALRRLMRGGRMSHVIRELRQLVDVLSDIQSALDNLNSIIQGNRDLAKLSVRVRRLRDQSRALGNAADILNREAGRLDCDNLPNEEEEGDGGFVGVGHRKKK